MYRQGLNIIWFLLHNFVLWYYFVQIELFFLNPMPYRTRFNRSRSNTLCSYYSLCLYNKHIIPSSKCPVVFFFLLSIHYTTTVVRISMSSRNICRQQTTSATHPSRDTHTYTRQYTYYIRKYDLTKCSISFDGFRTFTAYA